MRVMLGSRMDGEEGWGLVVGSKDCTSGLAVM
jgi:hypothetical protein